MRLVIRTLKGEKFNIDLMVTATGYKGQEYVVEELFGKQNPIASIAEAIVFAVYIPPQAPAPGQAFLIMH